MKKVYGPNAETKVRFEFVETSDVKPSEYLEMAKQCRDLGLKIDIQKLKEVTNLDFISEEEADLWTPTQDKDNGNGGI